MSSFLPKFSPALDNFKVEPKYEIVEQVGNGAYGFVISAIEKTSRTMVAIKKISPFDNEVHCQRTLREIKFLSRFHHENLIGLLDIFTGQDKANVSDLYIVLEYMQTDMHNVIKTYDLSETQICYFIYQIFRGLKYIHSAKVIHRDLKPSNILVNQNCDLKICDFGLSRVCGSTFEVNNKLTEYVATRWYRAPEIMLNSCHYSFPSDIWSVGCIFAELYMKVPLFPGKHYLEQIDIILRFLGSSALQNIQFIREEPTKKYLLTLPKYPGIKWEEKFSGLSECALVLLRQLLEFNPDKRPTAEEALAHSYLTEYHDPTDEPIALTEFEYDSNLDQLAKDEMKVEILKEIDFINTTIIFPPPPEIEINV